MGSDRSEPRWGVTDAVAGFFVGLVLSSMFASAWLSARGDPGEDLSLGGQGLAQIGLWIGLAGSAILATRLKGSGKLSEDFGFRARPVDLGIGAAGGVLTQAVLLPAIALLMRPLVGDPEVSGPVEDLLDEAQGIGLAGVFLFVVIGAPVVEELFFRGLLLRSLQRRIGPVWAVAVSSVLFGVAHPQPLPADAQFLVMVSLAAFAALLGTLAVRTGRLGPPIVAHATFNLWTLGFLLAR